MNIDEKLNQLETEINERVEQAEILRKAKAMLNGNGNGNGNGAATATKRIAWNKGGSKYPLAGKYAGMAVPDAVVDYMLHETNGTADLQDLGTAIYGVRMRRDSPRWQAAYNEVYRADGVIIKGDVVMLEN